jgi:hypothetical protein
VLFRQGAPGEDFFVIIQGEVDVFIDQAGSREPEPEYRGPLGGLGHHAGVVGSTVGGRERAEEHVVHDGEAAVR